MADEKAPASPGQGQQPEKRQDAPETKGKPRVEGGDLRGLAQAQPPKGVIGRVRGEGPARPAPLPMNHRKNVMAFTPPEVADRWLAEASGIQAVERDDNVITMFGMIGEDFWTGEGITARKVTSQLRAIGSRPVEVHINSFGGDMFEGIAIYNVLREHPQNITIKVMGIAASAASIIAMAGDERLIGTASFLMIHNCSVFAGGNRHDHKEVADFLAPFDTAMAGVYAQLTGLDAKDVAKMLDAETYLSGAEAVEKKFATGILPSDAMKFDAPQQAKAKGVHDLRAMELQLCAAGMPRSEARDRINKIKGTPGAAPEPEGTPGAALTDWAEAGLAFAASLKQKV